MKNKVSQAVRCMEKGLKKMTKMELQPFVESEEFLKNATHTVFQVSLEKSDVSDYQMSQKIR